MSKPYTEDDLSSIFDSDLIWRRKELSDMKAAIRLADASARLAMEKEIMSVVDRQIGAVGRPARVHFVSLLPKTRSGKLLRRSIQALAEGRDPGDLTTIEDPAALEQIQTALAAK